MAQEAVLVPGVGSRQRVLSTPQNGKASIPSQERGLSATQELRWRRSSWCCRRPLSLTQSGPTCSCGAWSGPTCVLLHWTARLSRTVFGASTVRYWQVFRNLVKKVYSTDNSQLSQDVEVRAWVEQSSQLALGPSEIFGCSAHLND